MNANTRVSSVLLCLLLYWGLIGLSGCASAPFDLGIESTLTPSAPVVPANAPEAEPTTPDAKPVDAEEDSDDRHPSRWRKKLRAKYA